MKRHTLLIIVLTTLMAMTVIKTHAKADRLVTISEMNIQKSWIKSHFTINKGQLPF
jgi:phosphoribosyl-dephospho-CoA transferase